MSEAYRLYITQLPLCQNPSTGVDSLITLSFKTINIIWKPIFSNKQLICQLVDVKVIH